MGPRDISAIKKPLQAIEGLSLVLQSGAKIAGALGAHIARKHVAAHLEQSFPEIGLDLVNPDTVICCLFSQFDHLLKFFFGLEKGQFLC